ncbi:MAG: HAMP domain-containing histidine kinase [Cyclobacteriaceae bacterium]|nr:HAMP domain-containing histidine kinase [Cyclobacteriaceae bacterium]
MAVTPTIDLYSNQSFLKWLVLVVSLIIGGGSIIYTNELVDDIREREYRQVTLYARALEYLANETNETGSLLFVLDEIVETNTTIPVILTDANGTPEFYRNLKRADKLKKSDREQFLRKKAMEMRDERDPIEVNLLDENGQLYGKKYIYYENSILLTQLQYYPYVQLLIIALFVLVTFAVFNYSRTSEQNRVWVGLAKETAHQLGTPLSSMMAWVDYLKTTYRDDKNIADMDKDLSRLEVVTARFSSIGSMPRLVSQDLLAMVQETVDYLQIRLSKKIQIQVVADSVHPQTHLNPELFSWVLENLCKNAVDAMEGQGKILIDIHAHGHHHWAVDVRDTGKGIAKNKMKQVFKPGFTTKKRGWGLGLTLVKRIVENYHGGKIYVKHSELGKGTTFRILLRAYKGEATDEKQTPAHLGI